MVIKPATYQPYKQGRKLATRGSAADVSTAVIYFSFQDRMELMPPGEVKSSREDF